MCSRGGVGVARGNSGLQPMKATVPFQFSNSSNSSKPLPVLRDVKPGEVKVSEKQLWCSLNGQIPPSQSLGTIVGPYLHGHWPKDGAHYKKDKSTQTPASWVDDHLSHPAGGLHKRSASWGSAMHREVPRPRQQQCAVVLGGSLDRRRTHALTQAGCGSSVWATQSQPVPMPLNAVHTRLRHSEEKLDQELESIFKHHSLLHLSDFLVPNGRRGPVPPYSGCSERQSGLSSSSSLSSSPAMSALSSLSSPSPSLPSSPVTSSLTELDGGVMIGLLRPPSAHAGQGGWATVPAPLLPRPNKSVIFQREPPEGCEKVPVCEEALSPIMDQSHVLPSCPDPDKVNFKPRKSSTFCPVSLHKAFLPSMDFLFRNLSVSGPEQAGQMGIETPPF